MASDVTPLVTFFSTANRKKRILLMCCRCSSTNLFTWIEIVYDHTVYIFRVCLECKLRLYLINVILKMNLFSSIYIVNPILS